MPLVQGVVRSGCRSSMVWSDVGDSCGSVGVRPVVDGSFRSICVCPTPRGRVICEGHGRKAITPVTHTDHPVEGPVLPPPSPPFTKAVKGGEGGVTSVAAAPSAHLVGR